MSDSTALTISSTTYGHGQKCPHCRFRSHSLYRIDSWEPNIEVCASCFIGLLIDGDYVIHLVDDDEEAAAATAQ